MRISALAAIVVLGCSTKELGPRAESDSSRADVADTFVEDSSAPDTFVADGAPDTFVEDSADGFVPDGFGFDAPVDADEVAVDSGTDVGFDAPPPCVPDDAGTDADGDAGCTRLRVVASNLTSGSAQNYESPGIHILQALQPDVALMQEFRYPSGLRALVDQAFGTTFQYAVEPDPGTIPNGIVSRYPILESGEWDDPDLTDRDFMWARIDVPGPIDLWAVSVHLRTTSSAARDAEAKNLVAYVKAKVPAGTYLVVGGDLNTALESEPALVDFGELLQVTTFAVDQAGNNKTNTSRSKPYDWVMPNAALYARMIPVTLAGLSFPTGLVFDTRVFTPLPTPALSTDSAASNMQHMAVVRDFAL